MTIINKILDIIFYPFAALFSIKVTDAIARFFKKYPILIFSLGFLVTVGIICAIYLL